jgi:hypothetical protein
VVVRHGLAQRHCETQIVLGGDSKNVDHGLCGGERDVRAWSVSRQAETFRQVDG